ncbi:MAG: autotransporter-associated beta strand repeat-containing protein [Verrucomicrobiae bacterium]|nr:autotransporter-associated beta strand repeat-containing protein [Verrucomicrobiae bacterium]
MKYKFSINFIKRGALYAPYLLLFFGLSPLHAQEYYWSFDGSSPAVGGSGNWNTSSGTWLFASNNGTATNWSNLSLTNTAFFEGTAGEVTLTTGIAANRLNVNATSGTQYRIRNNTLTLHGSNVQIAVASAQTLLMDSRLKGFAGFEKTGAGNLIITNNDNLLLGGIKLSDGTLTVSNSSNRTLRNNNLEIGSTATFTNAGVSGTELRIGGLGGAGTFHNGVAANDVFQFLLTNATFGGTATADDWTVRGLGTQTFTGNIGQITGPLAINGVQTGPEQYSSGITLAGNAQATNASMAVELRGGTLTLDNTAINSSDRLVDGGAITSLGGKISLVGNAAGTTETAGALTLNSSETTIRIEHNGGGGGTVLTLASLAQNNRGTLNFSASGGTLGTAGANPRILFTSAPTTNNGIMGGTGVSRGSVTINGNRFAGYDTTLGVFQAATTNVSGLLSSLNTSNVVITDNAIVNDTAKTFNSLVFEAGANKTLTLSNGNLVSQGFLLSGGETFTIENSAGGTGGISGGSGNHRYFHVHDTNGLLIIKTSLIPIATAGDVIKAGAGVMSLDSTSNLLTNSNARSIVLNGGTLRATTTALGGGGSDGGANTTIKMRGGVLEINGGGTFARALALTGTGSGGVLTFVEGATDRGNGGFSAINGNADVRLVTAVGGSTLASLQWNNGEFLNNGYALLFGSSKADSEVHLANNVALDGGTVGDYQARQIHVHDNASSSADLAILGGVISGSETSDLIKTGQGTLVLTNNNTYNGFTLIREGTLIARHDSALGSANAGTVVFDGATLRLQSNINVASEELVLNGTGIGTTGALRSDANTTNGWGGVITLTSASSIGTEAGSILSVTGNVSGVAALTKVGAGNLRLSGDKTFTGNFVLSNGTVSIDSDESLGLGALTFVASAAQGDNRLFAMTNVVVANSLTVTGQTGHIFTFESGGHSLEFSSAPVFQSTVDLAVRNTNSSGSTISRLGLSASGQMVYSNNISLDQHSALTLMNTAGGTNPSTNIVNLAGTLSGAGRVERGTAGGGEAGTLILSASNSHAGGTYLYGGALGIGHSNALGTGTLFINDSTLGTARAQLFATNGNQTVTNAVQYAKTSNTTFIGSSDLTFSGAINVLATNQSGDTLDTIRLVVSNSGLTTLSGGLTATNGTQNLFIRGGQTLALSGTNTLSGSITITNGTLRLTNTLTTATNGVSISNGATLVANGALRVANSHLAISNGSTLDVNGSFDVQGDVLLDAGSTVNNLNLNEATGDFFRINGDFTNNATINLDNQAGGATLWSTFRGIEVTGSFTNLGLFTWNFTAPPSGTLGTAANPYYGGVRATTDIFAPYQDGSGFFLSGFSATGLSADQYLKVYNTGGFYYLAIIPEPSTVDLLLPGLLLAAALTALRKWRRRQV